MSESFSISIMDNSTSVRFEYGLSETTMLIFQSIHTMLTVVALGNNCFSLVVIYGIVARLTPPLQLLTSLAFSDMLAPWAIMTMYFPASACQEEIHSALLLTAHNSSALALVVLALSHSMATFKPLHYDRFVSQKRVWISINIVWIISILTAHSHFLATLTHHDTRLSFCVNVQNNMMMALFTAASFSGLLALVTLAIYTCMFFHLRPIEAALSSSDVAAQSRKSTRSVVTGVILSTLHLICWVPYIVTKFYHAEDFSSPPMSVLYSNSISQTTVLIACCFQPVVYGLRMTNMQTGYHRLYQRTKGWCVVTWSRLRKQDTDGDDQPSTPLNPIESIC